MAEGVDRRRPGYVGTGRAADHGGPGGGFRVAGRPGAARRGRRPHRARGAASRCRPPAGLPHRYRPQGARADRLRCAERARRPEGGGGAAGCGAARRPEDRAHPDPGRRLGGHDLLGGGARPGRPFRGHPGARRRASHRPGAGRGPGLRRPPDRYRSHPQSRGLPEYPGGGPGAGGTDRGAAEEDRRAGDRGGEQPAAADRAEGGPGLPALRRAPDRRLEHRGGDPVLDGGAPAPLRPAAGESGGGRHQLRDAGAGPAHARIRRRQDRRGHPGPLCRTRRSPPAPGRVDGQAHARDPGDRRRPGPDRPRRYHGRGGQRHLRRHHGHRFRGGALQAPDDSRTRPGVRHADRLILPLRKRGRSDDARGRVPVCVLPHHRYSRPAGRGPWWTGV